MPEPAPIGKLPSQPFLDLARHVPDSWLILFHRRSSIPWVNRLVRGRYKHVSALAYVAQAQCWVWFEFDMWRTRILLCDGADDGLWLKAVTYQCDVLQIAPLAPPRRLPFVLRTCVSSVKHLIGLRCGALRPDALWRDCLAAGAKVVTDE